MRLSESLPNPTMSYQTNALAAPVDWSVPVTLSDLAAGSRWPTRTAERSSGALSSVEPAVAW